MVMLIKEIVTVVSMFGVQAGVLEAELVHSELYKMAKAIEEEYTTKS